MALGEVDRQTSERGAIEAIDAELRDQRRLAERHRELAELRAARIELLERRLVEARTASRSCDQQARVIELEQELARVSVRLARIQSSLPARAWERLRRLPPMSWIARRRAREYWRQLDSARRR
jgi:predicted  nucleic acid-binding Zn-ribbon protein